MPYENKGKSGLVFSTFVNGEFRIAEKAVPVSQAREISVQIHIALQEIFILKIVPLKSDIVFSFSHIKEDILFKF